MGAVEAEEGQDDPAMCARAWWRRSGADMARHHATDERPGQKKMSTRSRGSRRGYCCIQFNSRWSKGALPLVMARLNFIVTAG
jgi:hypothetical protein